MGLPVFHSFTEKPGNDINLTQKNHNHKKTKTPDMQKYMCVYKIPITNIYIYVCFK